MLSPDIEGSYFQNTPISDRGRATCRQEENFSEEKSINAEEARRIAEQKAVEEKKTDKYSVLGDVE